MCIRDSTNMAGPAVSMTRVVPDQLDCIAEGGEHICAVLRLSLIHISRTLLFDAESGEACIRSYGRPELIF